MIREQTKYLVDKAVYDECHHIITEKPLFHSDHEGYAVLLEEVEEVEVELKAIKEALQDTWEHIKVDRPPYKEIEQLKRRAKMLAAEAVQVVAVTDKFFVRKGEKNE